MTGFARVFTGRAASANHNQPGDPVKAVTAILRLCTEKPPLRIQLGSDAVGLVAGRLAFMAAEQAARASCRCRRTSTTPERIESAVSASRL
ncbi:hypothetical protein [Mycolicibacterium sphagni]|uniref:Uncharacterized protein n=1 Tax=Mycolicibacterium sphagni TaxID=1786 RepID=A0ABX2JNT5_9MYCO|nr:hypothetical protein [Mycolicibacterium sphagni]NTY58414.1 hypothetical protein [Mycolicibacterium sphagni]